MLLQLALLSLRDICDAGAEANLARLEVLRNKGDFRRAIGAWPYFPDRGFQRVTGLDGGCEANPEELQGPRIPAAHSCNDSTCCEAERRQSMQDHSTESGRFPYLRVCVCCRR